MAEQEHGVPLLYVGVEDVPIELANQFGIIYDAAGGEFILTIGQLQLPQLLGSDEERQEQLGKLSHVGIKVLGRYVLTRPRVEALMTMLQTNLGRVDEGAST